MNQKACLAEDTAAQAARIMKCEDVRAVPVVRSSEDRNVVGVVTARDLALKVIAEGRDPNSVLVEEIMSRQFHRADHDESEEVSRIVQTAGKALLGGFCLGLGAALMFVFDPSRGRRRRALIRDRAAHLGRQSGDFLGKVARDLRNRAEGTVATTRSLLRNAEVGDAQLEARVRSKLGRTISHPHAVHVSAMNGRVILDGAVLEQEADRLMRTVAAIEGVREVENRLTVHATSDDVPELQGGRERSGEQWEAAQSRWSSAARVLASAAGGSLLLLALAKGKR